MTPSNVIGELMLIRLVITVFACTNSCPKRIPAMSTLSCARPGSVTEPMNGLSDSVMWACSMSRCRLFTATSVGSHTVPPEWCSHFDM